MPLIFATVNRAIDSQDLSRAELVIIKCMGKWVDGFKDYNKFISLTNNRNTPKYTPKSGIHPNIPE